MAKPDTVYFIVADETFNAGERDYTKAFSWWLKKLGVEEGTDVQFYKVQPQTQEAIDAARIRGGDPRVVPLTDAQYKAVPIVGNATVANAQHARSVLVIGAGHSTLDAVAELSEYFRLTRRECETAYVTHIPESAEELKKVAAHGMHLYAETTRDNLESMVPGLDVKFTRIEKVPNTNAEEFCREHLAVYEQTEQGKKTLEAVKSGQPFVFAVLNAGFEVGDPKVFTPYTVDEAKAHGAALGKYLPAGTNLILAHGGPRNLRDEGQPGSVKPGDTHAGQDTTTAFTEAYKAAQTAKGIEPEVFIERYKEGTGYDAVKVGYLLGREDNCLMWVSNDEGFGTKSAAATHVDNSRKVLGSFQFAAEYADVTGQRQASIEEWHAKGVAKLSVDADGGLVVTRHAAERPSSPAEDSAPIILRELGVTVQAQAQAKPVQALKA